MPSALFYVQMFADVRHRVIYLSHPKRYARRPLVLVVPSPQCSQRYAQQLRCLSPVDQLSFYYLPLGIQKIGITHRTRFRHPMFSLIISHGINLSKMSAFAAACCKFGGIAAPLEVAPRLAMRSPSGGGKLASVRTKLPHSVQSICQLPSRPSFRVLAQLTDDRSESPDGGIKAGVVSGGIGSLCSDLIGEGGSILGLTGIAGIVDS